MAQTRTQAAAKNLKSAFFGIFINLVLNFSGRKIFVLVLGKEYVGLSSLFGNLLNILSICDLGFSGAVTYALYRPLSKKDFATVTDIMRIFKSVCRATGFFIFGIGLLLLPYIDNLVGEVDRVENIGTIYVLFLLSQSLAYLFQYRRILLFSDQKNYVSQNFQYAFGILSTAACAVALVVTKNYYLYLSVQILVQLAEDISLSRFVKKLYPQVDFKSKRKVPRKLVRKLFRDTLQLQPNNIGSTLLRSTDNFVVAQLFGVAQNGVYSNYNMLLGTAGMISLRLVGAITASVGNLGAGENREKVKRVFSVTMLISFFFTCVCTTVLCVLSSDFITLWLGKGMTLPFSVSCTLAASFFVSGLRQGVLIFRDAYGLYRKERIKPFAEVAISLALTIFFGKRMGIVGVYFGQLCASVFACLWYEPYILYKYGFHESAVGHYKRMLVYSVIAFCSCACSYRICTLLSSFGARLAVCVCLPALFVSAVYFPTYEFRRAFATALEFTGLKKPKKNTALIDKSV